jgi:hypothetical protein
MKIKQYVYFGIGSEMLPPDEIGRQVGLPPDRALLRGSRTKSPPRPAIHTWQIRCDEPGLPIDEMIGQVMARLAPSRAAIRELVKTSDHTTAWLQIVRNFNTDDGEDEVIDVDDGLEKLAGQHQLLGWHLNRDVLDFLSEVGAELDADEYG